MAYFDVAGLDGSPQLPSIKTEYMIDRDNNYIDVDFLFPNGILLPFSVDYFSPMDQIKSIIWREVHNYPLADNLRAENSYNFFFINRMGEREEVMDESQNLEELQPFLAMFQLVENKEDDRSKTLDKKIDHLIGRGIQKQESFQTAEINHFKQKMSEMAREITILRRAKSPMEKFQWKYPVRLRSHDFIPSQVESRIVNGAIVVDIGFGEAKMCYKLRVSHNGTPEDAVKMALNKKRTTLGTPLEDSKLYILKVIGQEEYLYGEHSLIQFKYVYQCLVKNTAPQFWMVRKDTLPEATPPVPYRPTPSPILHQDSVKSNDIIVWNIKVPYKIQVQGISKLQLADGTKVKLYVGVYHGAESLCKEKVTEEQTVQSGSCQAKTDIEFDIHVADLPHSARLCFALYTIGSTKRQDLCSWVNIPVYDFKLRLQRGDRELPMWPQDLLQQPEEHCYPLGGVSLNVLRMDASFVKVNFPDVAYTKGAYLVYPPYDKVLECASENMVSDGEVGSPSMKVSKIHLEQLAQALYQSDQLFEQDKELIWMLRYEVCQRFPNSLTRVLQSVKWNSYIEVATMTALLQTWPTLPVDFALEILDYEYPDRNVREFAVKCLDKELSDDDLAQYLLQLVQALKFETHLCCPLAEFLLRRALKNQHMGHKLFWLLKSETYNAAVSTQYRLLLECYLRHNEDHLLVLMKQQEALKKLCGLNSLIKLGNIGDQAHKEQAMQHMTKVLNQKTYKKCLSQLSSPLTPLYKMRELRVEKCKFMSSKKRPLWLVWENSDEMGPDIQIIYKNGDDLRQDMLTLQILQVMDNLWQAEGLDFRMNPYMCMATDLEQGMIEVVSPADTMANIQRWFKKTAFDKRALFEWLKMKHKSPEHLDAAVEEFLMSCAGYCVATYVIGVGDRHNDNIMMKSSGQMFHIDFGHFLGNFKSKFHVKRERVPFVLTSHFVYVITKGDTERGNFDRFRVMCEKAFLILRNKYSLLMSLFMMMLSGGIPQLSSPKDVNYLRETLVPHLSEIDARAHFRSKFNQALKGAWKTSLNFWFHIQLNQ
ncbi:phosphatidylinositol 4,5-bisphosphate 3-kinase catalytic subunit beta isoform [Aplysia californica]|uniref:Phosphatidylinositol 4,5-bisphosphate 3-kinase catalytic subunit beta isoform n=1 Tax=Aplysia californica TaxID=6500 RepID=A0ABM1AAD3_APLCA|nr:phosphatidylinositol 4,5-bisphosphate 3-kinase catalytic subunit beta isoform [Aplysia californica]